MITPIPLLAFAIFFSCVSLVSHPSIAILKCLWVEQQATGISLKKTAGWDVLTASLENITSWACLEISGLKDIFKI